jgi:hypothetical protein
MELSLAELCERLEEKYDPDELVDMLRISNKELLRAFVHKVQAYRENFSQDEEPDSEFVEED